uniref:Uncharacterized aarF domain-containing protein kinase 1 n=1 Tax=Hydra vulgaris TaxID=6087 RepID=T2MA03_HYDVU
MINLFKKFKNDKMARHLCKRTLQSAVLTFAVVTHVKNDNIDGKWNQFKFWIFNEYTQKVTHSTLMRFGRATYTVVSVVLDYKYSLAGIDFQSSQYCKKKSECHLRSAKKFRELCSLNGGLFMKIGQHIGSLEFLFPKEYTETLKCFQYQAPASNIDDVRYVIESETNQKIEELFSEFNPEPIGAASLAQVHQAVLKDGTSVAVKVQHRTVKKYALADAKFIEFFVGLASSIFPEFRFQWLVDQIKESIPLETDFLHEGRNCEKLANMLKDISFLKVPKIYWKNSTERVLVMEFCQGGVIDDLDFIKKNNINRNDISSKLGRLYSEMIFVQGFIHCDPHPGNILVRLSASGSTEIILLDHGLYQTLPTKTRLTYCDLWQSLINSDINGIKKCSEMLGVGEYYGLFACMVSGRSWQSIQDGIERKSITGDELNEIQNTAVQLVSTITEVLEKLPREMVLIFKTNDLLRGLDARLGTKVSFITMSKCCIRAKFNNDLSKSGFWYQKMMLYFRFSLNSFKLWIYGIFITNYYLNSALNIIKI